MKLTPLDIHHKEFRHAVRGYSEEEVDGFLDEVAEEFERLVRQNLDLTEQIQALNERLRAYQQLESTLHNTLLTAQRSADDTIAKAQQEADAIKREADGKATEIVHEALQGRQDAITELSKLRQAQADFREEYRRLLTSQLDRLGDSEVSVSADVEQILGESNGGRTSFAQPVGFSAGNAAGQRPYGAPAVVPTAAPIAEPESAPEAEAAPEPELVAEHIELTDPEEFEIPSLSVLGEREDDIDIEEID